VVRDSLTTPDAIAHVVSHAVRHGFNTLLVQVRGRGEAYYEGGPDPRAPALAGQPPAFDPLRRVLDDAHAAGLQVHAWINVNLVASATYLPVSRDHVANRHPEWLMVPRALAQDLVRQPAHGPGYIGKIARWARAQPDVEGLYLSPIAPAAASYSVAVVEDLVRRYPLDGIHLDYLRYPGPDFDYSRLALDEFEASMATTVTPAERRLLTARAGDDVLAWADAYPERWADFRRSRLTALLMRIRTGLRRLRPGLPLSAAVSPHADEAASARFQDWPLWAESGLLDVLCPMAYTTDLATFRGQIGDAVRSTPAALVWAGIGAYRLSPPQTVEHIRAARTAGAHGVALFSYDAIAAGSAEAYLETIRRSAFATSSPGQAR
jgi:uncharacterized lipoprotein YddW (UPF0748 family)